MTKALIAAGCAGLIACVALADAKHQSHSSIFEMGPVSVPAQIAPSLPAGTTPDWTPAPASQVVVPQTTTTTGTSPHPSSSHLTGFAACWQKYYAHQRSKPC